MKNEKRNLGNLYTIIGISLVLVSNYYFYYKQQFSAVIDYKVLISIVVLFFFSLIFLYLLNFFIKYFSEENKISKLIILIISCWLGVQCLKGFFLSTNFITLSNLIIESKILFLLQDNQFLFRFSKFILPYFIFFLLVITFKDISLKIFKFSAFFGFILILVCFYREVVSNFNFSNSTIIFNYEKKNDENFKSNSKKKVLWFLFDEFDPEIAFKNHKNENFMNNFKKFMNEGVYHDDFYSPAAMTINAIPSLLMGIQTNGNYIKNYKYFLIDKNKQLHEFKYENTIFGRLDKLNIKSTIKSSLFPYCTAYIKFNKYGNCYESEEASKVSGNYYFPGIKYVYSFFTKFKISYFLLSKEQKNLKKKNKEIEKISDFEKIFNTKLKIDYESIDDVDGHNTIFFSDIKKDLKSNNGLFYYHVNLPHDPYYFSQEIYNISTEDGLASYLLNLKLSDLVIKRIFKIIKDSENSDVLLIISSDHWYRKKNKIINKYFPSLFFAKIFNDNKSIKIQKSGSGIYVQELIYKYLTNQVTNHEEIRLLFEDESKKFYKPFIN